MRFSHIISLDLLAISGALAATVPSNNSTPTHFERLGLTWPPLPGFSCCMFVTAEPRWQGPRNYGCVPPNRCGTLLLSSLLLRARLKTIHPLTENLPVYLLDYSGGQVSSFGPDKNSGLCQLYEYVYPTSRLTYSILTLVFLLRRHDDCTGAMLESTNPGFEIMPADWDLRAQSVMCAGSQSAASDDD